MALRSGRLNNLIHGTMILKSGRNPNRNVQLSVAYLEMNTKVPWPKYWFSCLPRLKNNICMNRYVLWRFRSKNMWNKILLLSNLTLLKTRLNFWNKNDDKKLSRCKQILNQRTTKKARLVSRSWVRLVRLGTLTSVILIPALKAIYFHLLKYDTPHPVGC